MRIESLIRREGGTRIKLGKEHYHFKPSADDPRHTATVADEDHIQTFLAIKEGFSIAKKIGDTAKVSTVHIPQHPQDMVGQEAQEDERETGATVTPLTPNMAPRQNASGIGGTKSKK